MKYSHIIWDFNGTILDDVQACIESVNVLLTKRGLPVLSSVEAYRAIQEFPVINYYVKLGFDFEKESFDDVAVEWVEEYLRRFPHAEVYPEVLKTIAQCREKGMAQILLSATELSMLKKQVQALNIDDCFDEICGMDNIYAHGKISLAERWRDAHPNAKALFVGDTDHDLAVARAIGADCVLFAGGHQARARLEKHGCPVIDSFSELNRFL